MLEYRFKLQAGGTKPTSNCWFVCIFYWAAYNKKQTFCIIYAVYSYSYWKTGNYLLSVNIISNVRICGNSLKKTQNKTKQGSLFKVVKVHGFSSSAYRSRRLFFMLKICLLVKPQISIIIWATLQWRNVLFSFSRYFSLFVCHVRETRRYCQSSWKFTSLIYKILKS